jgi:phosphoglycerate dehydrogenase-like enzyme
LIRLLHLAAGRARPEVWTDAFRAALAEVGDLTMVEQAARLSEAERARLIRGYDVLLTSWGAAPVPAMVAREPGELRYVCHITGEVRAHVPLAIIAAGILVTNWGDAAAGGMAEGAMALLLTAVKALHARIQEVRQGGWRLEAAACGGTLEGLKIGLYGCGAVGRRFVEMLRPFRPVVRIYDPYVADLPEGCQRVGTLAALFGVSETIAIHAALTEETRGSVTGELLARLPDGGVLVNTARGAIVDQRALFAELARGRLRAGLDVIDGEPLDRTHPARRWENLVLGCHQIACLRPPVGHQVIPLGPMHRICLDNLRRFAGGHRPQFVIDTTRYRLTT